MNFEDWEELRDHLIEAFGDEPHPAVETVIVAAYQRHPDALEKAAFLVISGVQTGELRSGWGVLRSRAERISTPTANPKGSASRDREKAIGRAEAWVRNAGCMFDRETELLEELFERNGLLAAHAADDLVRQRITELYRQQRPNGAQLEGRSQAGLDDWKRTHTCPRCGKAYAASRCPTCTREQLLAAQRQRALEDTPL